MRAWRNGNATQQNSSWAGEPGDKSDHFAATQRVEVSTQLLHKRAIADRYQSMPMMSYNPLGRLLRHFNRNEARRGYSVMKDVEQKS